MEWISALIQCPQNTWKMERGENIGNQVGSSQCQSTQTHESIQKQQFLTATQLPLCWCHQTRPPVQHTHILTHTCSHPKWKPSLFCSYESHHELSWKRLCLHEPWFKSKNKPPASLIKSQTATGWTQKRKMTVWGSAHVLYLGVKSLCILGNSVELWETEHVLLAARPVKNSQSEGRQRGKNLQRTKTHATIRTITTKARLLQTALQSTLLSDCLQQKEFQNG